MPPNPYESPKVPSGKANQTAIVVMRVFAVLAWILCLIPVTAFGVGFAVFEDFGRRRGLPASLLIGAVVALGLPTAGMALLGAACWRRSQWLAIAGLAAFVPLVIGLIRLHSGGH